MVTSAALPRAPTPLRRRYAKPAGSAPSRTAPCPHPACPPAPALVRGHGTCPPTCPPEGIWRSAGRDKEVQKAGRRPRCAGGRLRSAALPVAVRAARAMSPAAQHARRSRPPPRRSQMPRIELPPDARGQEASAVHRVLCKGVQNFPVTALVLQAWALGRAKASLPSCSLPPLLVRQR